MEPSISVIITCYNEAGIIGEAIESVLHQSAISSIIQIIIVDDGSTDDSPVVIQKYQERSPLILYVYQENQGLAGARNSGISHVSGEYIAFLDGDDLWHPTKLEVYLGLIKRNESVGLFYSSFYQTSRQTDKRKLVVPNRYKPGLQPKQLLKKFYVHGGPLLPSTVVLKREVLDNVGMFDIQMRKAQDTELWLRIAGKYSFYYIDSPLVDRMGTPGSLGSDPIKKLEYMLLALNKIEALYPFLKSLRNKRLALVYHKISSYCLKQKRKNDSRQYAALGLKCNPWSLRSYLQLFKSYLG